MDGLFYSHVAFKTFFSHSHNQTDMLGVRYFAQGLFNKLQELGLNH